MIVKIDRAPADPICSRISIGGNKEIGCYCVFRGEASECINLLKKALNVMEIREKELASMPVNRKYEELGGS